MKKLFKNLIMLTLLLAKFTVGVANDRLIVYPAPKGATLNNDFTVKVRQKGKNWQEVPVYLIKVARAENYIKKAVPTSMVSFSFSGEIEVQVRSNKQVVSKARVRPLSYNIAPEVKGDIVQFELIEARNLSIEVNDDIFNNLHLFANPIETHGINPKDPNVIYFGPGIHEVANQKFYVPAGKTVYLDGGAVLNAEIIFDRVWDAKLVGYGMVNQEKNYGIRIKKSENIYVEGVIGTQCFIGGSNNVTIRNVKAISYGRWGDGMNVMSSNNVLFDGVFNRNSDDCTTVYGSRGEYVGGCNNVTMKNSILWADNAHPIFIGVHGNTKVPEILENLNYINIDILDHNESQIDYQGAMALNAGDSNLIRNVRFENIRVENFRKGQLFNFRVFFNSKYCTSPGRGLENILIKDVNYVGNHSNMSIIEGYDESRKIKNITFENLRINGVHISDTMKNKPGYFKTGDMANIYVGNHVDGIVFK